METVRSLREHPVMAAETLRQQFGKRLRVLRVERSLTQEQFAELTGISVDFLSLIERGVRSPSFESIELIAKRLGLNAKDLFDFPKRSGGRR